jgi:hypothetical protein
VEEGRIVRGALKACLGRIRGEACYSGNIRTEAELLDDLLPLPGSWQDADPRLIASTLKIPAR